MDIESCPGEGMVPVVRNGRPFCPVCDEPLPVDLSSLLPLPAHGQYVGTEEDEERLAETGVDVITKGPLL